MTVEKNVTGNTAELKIGGWLDTQTAPLLGKAIDELEETVTELVLNFKELEYTSSAGLRQIIMAYKRMNGRLTIKNVSAEVMDVFEMTGFAQQFHII